MRLALIALLLSTAAHADIGPRPPKCKVPPRCVTCTDIRAEGIGECRGQAADAGLVESSCTDRQGSSTHHYFCPPDDKATRPSCASVGELGLGVLGALTLLLRRRAAFSASR